MGENYRWPPGDEWAGEGQQEGVASSHTEELL